MSLAIVLEAIDGLVLAADSRATAGYTLDGPKTRDTSIKFIQLNSDWGVLTYGLSKIGHTGLSSLKEEVLKDMNHYISLPNILKMSKQIFKKVSSDWERKNSEIGRLDKDVGFILAGYERDDRAFRVFNFQSPEFTPKSPRNGCLLAGQWHIAKYLFNRLYTKEMDADRLKDLAAFLLDATMTVEQTVGGAIHLGTITRSGGFRWIIDSELEAIMEKNRAFNKLFQKHFYGALLAVRNHIQKETIGEDI